MNAEWDLALRAVVALLAGAALGVDREVRNKPAGLRTLALVSLASAVFTMIALEYAEGSGGAFDPLRVIQGVIVGVGFLGGGVILRDSSARSDPPVFGLTTAASVWLAAALGVAFGMGEWLLGVVGLVLTLITLVLPHPIEEWLHRRAQ